ncbi:MAG: aldose epimerase family protein [Acutalibacteraceae bacterium]|nr:aldose epimerase family protein [Acutalibacteraceae bacterium]
MSVTKTLFDTMPDGTEVHLLTIENNNGVSAGIITRGATLQSFNCPDKDGVMGDIIMGFDTVAGHMASGTYTGNIIGQYANRICGGKFTVGGKEYQVTQNEKGKTCLHGGGEFNSAIWKAIIIDDDAVEFSYKSPDGKEGFPGNLDVTVTYILTDHNELEIHYKAVPDCETIINMTNHAYFNLGTPEKGDVLDHELQLFCDYYTPTDADSIPTGEKRSVEGTAFDFREGKKIGKDIKADDEQLIMCRGYDHNFCVNGEIGVLRPVAKVKDEKSGRKLEVYSDLPGVQLYTGNFIDGTETGKNGTVLQQHYGFCLETQYYPDTPNQPSFPQCTFKKGEAFESVTIFKV